MKTKLFYREEGLILLSGTSYYAYKFKDSSHKLIAAIYHNRFDDDYDYVNYLSYNPFGEGTIYGRYDAAESKALADLKQLGYELMPEHLKTLI